MAQLGVNAVWIAPVLRQRMKVNSYHGYGIQHFLDVDPRLGTRQDLVDLVTAAHAAGIRIILDIVFNHTGCNWWYVVDGTARVRFSPSGCIRRAALSDVLGTQAYL